MKKRAKMKRLAVMNKYLRDLRSTGLRIQVTFRYWRSEAVHPPEGLRAAWTTNWTAQGEKHETCMDTTETVAFLRGAAWAAFENGTPRPRKSKPVEPPKSDLLDPARPELGRSTQIIRELPIAEVHTLSALECRRIMAHAHPYRKDINAFKKAVYAHLTKLREEAAAK